jgi:uncharacterized protein (DUF2147 family)
MRRRAVITLALTLVACAASVGSASAAEPIEGQWQEPSGRVLEFFATGTNTFSDRIVSGTQGSCNSSARNTKLTGSGLNYSGTVSFYRSSDCGPVGDGTIKVTVAPDGQSMKLGYAQPSDQSCCSSEEDLVRVVAPTEPIEGRWKLLDGIIDIVPAGGGGYKANVIAPINKACPDHPFDLKLSGSGASYTGTVSFYDNNGCGATNVGQGSVTVDMAADNQSAHFVANPPQAVGGNTTDTTITRVNTVRGATLAGKLPLLVNDILVGFQKQYKVLQRAAKKRRGGLLRTMARSATAGKKKVQDYNALPSEAKLKACALKGIAQVHAASVRGSNKTAPGAGMRAIAKCLGPFKTEFPLEQPGRVTPKPPKPGNPGVPISKLGAYISRINRFNSTRVTRFDILVKGDSIVAVEMAVLWSCTGPDGFQSRPVIFKYPDSVYFAAPIDKLGYFSYDGYVWGIRVRYSGRVLGPRALGHVELDYTSADGKTVCRTGQGNWNGSLYTNPDDFKIFGPPGVAGTDG